MAEVATGVLHNVGNVLNSIGVAVSQINKLLKNSRLSYLTNVVQLLEEHVDNLGAFVTTDTRGRRLPAFIADLSQNLAKEREHLTEESEKLIGYVQHVTEIINLQQSYGRTSGLVEKTLISELVEDAVRISAESLARHNIEVKREYGQLPSTLLDRTKVLQILTNLVSNAKHALTSSHHDHRWLLLRTTMVGDSTLRVEVTDNGIGIAKEDQTRVFGYGFTTRKDGHGFGLHGAALSAREMGGTLTLHSDGPGQGATFVLELPLVTGDDGDDE